MPLADPAWTGCRYTPLPAGHVQPGAVCWVDLLADVGRELECAALYQDLFGWQQAVPFPMPEGFTGAQLATLTAQCC